MSKRDEWVRSTGTVDLTHVDDDDLVRVLRHLNRHSMRGRIQAAKDPVTRAYLQAGLRLIERQFAPYDDDDESDRQSSPFFAWVSRQKVVDEIQNEPNSSGLPKPASINGLRDRWEPHRNYISDLLSVVLASDHWSLSVARDEQLLQDMLTGDFPDAAHELAFADLEALTSAAISFRVQMIAASFAERDGAVREALRQLYAVVTENWSRVYRAVLDDLGASFRPGITIERFTHMLTAAAEGFALRLLADPEADVIDRERRRSLLGTMALSLMIGCVDLFGDEMTVEDVVRTALAARRAQKTM